MTAAGVAPCLTKGTIRAALERHPSTLEDDMSWLAGQSLDLQAQVRDAMPLRRTPAAVLVPLIERQAGFSVLLTQRAADLKDHAGQISFPGGRIEAGDGDPWLAALREAEEEVGLDRGRIEFGGYLPDHLLLTGYRVTPVVGFVPGDCEVRIDPAEVHDAFEVPLPYLFDPANHRPRVRTLAGVRLETIDIPFQHRIIWGLTAGVLMTLRRRLNETADRCR